MRRLVGQMAGGIDEPLEEIARMIRVLGEAERGCIFRMGRFYRVVGPGPVLVIPLIDQIGVVDLDRALPEWREVSAEELKAMVEFLVTHYPEVPSGLGLAGIREAMYVGEESARRG